MNIGWPEGIWIGLVCIGMLASAALHGKPRTGEHNFAVSFTMTLMMFGLLYWGGFFA